MADGVVEAQTWLQWVLGLAFAASAGAHAHQWLRLDRTRDALRAELKDGDDKIWAELGKAAETSRHDLTSATESFRRDLADLRKMIEDDRRLAATDRAYIAATMLTRAEFDRGIDRLLGNRAGG